MRLLVWGASSAVTGTRSPRPWPVIFHVTEHFLAGDEEGTTLRWYIYWGRRDINRPGTFCMLTCGFSAKAVHGCVPSHGPVQGRATTPDHFVLPSDFSGDLILFWTTMRNKTIIKKGFSGFQWVKESIKSQAFHGQCCHLHQGTKHWQVRDLNLTKKEGRKAGIAHNKQYAPKDFC